MASVGNSPVSSLVERLRRDAERYEGDGALVRADVVLRRLAHEVEDWWHGWNEELLDVSAAAAQSGYSEEHLRELVRQGKLRRGRPGRPILLRRCDLPRHPVPPIHPVVENLSNSLRVL